MGSFSTTCCASDLPIPGGTPVRLFLLSGNPYDEQAHGCEPTSKWVPRSFPIKGIYDDCGSIEEAEDSLAQRVMLDFMAIDGEGLDLSKGKDGRPFVDLTSLLSSVVVGEVSVRRGQKQERSHTRYLPSTEKEKKAAKKKAEEADSRWRKMTNRKPASVSDYQEPLVTVPVRQLMIREDVWQSLCNITLPPYCGDKDHTLADTREAVGKFWTYMLTKHDPEYGLQHHVVEKDIGGRNLSHVFNLIQDKVPFQLGTASAFHAAVERAKEGSTTKEEVDEFLDVTAEFLFVSDVLFFARRAWAPSHSSGTQEATWDHSLLYLRAITDVAQKNFEKEQEEQRKWDQELPWVILTTRAVFRTSLLAGERQSDFFSSWGRLSRGPAIWRKTGPSLGFFGLSPSKRSTTTTDRSKG